MSSSELKRTSETVSGSLVSDDEPKSTTAYTDTTLDAGQPSASLSETMEIVLPLMLTHESSETSDIRESLEKSRVVSSSVTGSTKSTWIVRLFELDLLMPESVATSSAGASDWE